VRDGTRSQLPSRHSQVFSSVYAALGIVSRGTRSHEGGTYPVFVPDGKGSTVLEGDPRGGSMTTIVRDVMSTDLVTVEPSTMMTEAAAAMSSAGVGSVLVLEEGALVGIFTERDILSAFEQFRADPARVSPVSKGTTRNPLTIGPDATVGEAMDKMLDGGFRHLPVMDGRTLVGIVSMRDLARSISKG
jgi:CBS domain-containing protein